MNGGLIHNKKFNLLAFLSMGLFLEDVNKTVSAKSKILTLLTRFFCMKEEFDLRVSRTRQLSS